MLFSKYEMLRAERETTAKDELSGFIKGERGGEGFIRLINTHQYDFGGRGATREMFVQELKDGLASLEGIHLNRLKHFWHTSLTRTVLEN